MSEPVTQQVYPSLDAYEKCPKLGAARWTSQSFDFGDFWRDLHDTWTISWIEKTGELIAHLRADEHHLDTVEILRVFSSLSHVEQALEGWRRECGRDGSLGWLKGRVARWVEPEPVREFVMGRDG